MEVILNSMVDRMIAEAEEIEIVSGEGEEGTAEEYDGKRSRIALGRKLIEETAGGDRWAFARIDGGPYKLFRLGRLWMVE